MHPLRTLLSVLAVSSVAVGGAVVAAAPASAADPVAKTYYVDCSSRKTGDGSATKPFRTLSAVNAHAAFAPGDTIKVKRGTVCKGRLAPRGSGSPGAPITLTAYGKGARPTIAGGGTGQHTGAVHLRSQHDWVIENLHVTNRGKGKYTTVYRSGILVANEGAGPLANITIRGNLVDNVTSNLADSKKGNSREFGGISVLSSGRYGTLYDNVRISKNAVNGVSRTGITTWNSVYQGIHDTNVRIDGNSVRWARGDSIVTVGLDGGRIDRNVSAYGSNMSGCPNCGGISPRTANAGIWPSGSRNVVIEYNEVYGEHAWGGDGEGFDVDQNSSNIVLQYNYSHDNEGGGLLLCGSDTTTVRFNIFEDNKKSAIAFIGTYPAKNTKIYNNTIYSSRASGARVVRYFNGARGSGISFKNNLVYGYGPADYLWPVKKVSTAANTLIGNHGKGRPTDGATSTRDPGLKAAGTGKVGRGSLQGYKPKHPSTFKKGVAIPSTVTRDFFGKKIDPKRPPRGAAG